MYAHQDFYTVALRFVKFIYQHVFQSNKTRTCTPTKIFTQLPCVLLNLSTNMYFNQRQILKYLDTRYIIYTIHIKL